MRIMGRRRFLFALAGVGLVALGIGGATRRPAPTLITSACQGAPRMTDRILVTYATRTGSTAEVADAIAGRLCEAGLSAEARPMTEVTSLEGYSGAVLGSAVHYASWLPEMTDFVSANRDALSAMPVAFFTMHMLAVGDDPARLSFFDRLAVRLVKSPVSDRRDWERIAAWTDRLAPLLTSAPT